MPRYDFECPHRHRFEHSCAIADREQAVPCEGTVNELVDDELLTKYTGPDAMPLPDDMAWVSDENKNEFLVKKVRCRLMAKMIISHNNPGGMLDHGSASNRDAAREGRYDPLNPNRRFMTKGRAWRR
jgi:hypothetical protein